MIFPSTLSPKNKIGTQLQGITGALGIYQGSSNPLTTNGMIFPFSLSPNFKCTWNSQTQHKPGHTTSHRAQQGALIHLSKVLQSTSTKEHGMSIRAPQIKDGYERKEQNTSHREQQGALKHPSRVHQSTNNKQHGISFQTEPPNKRCTQGEHNTSHRPQGTPQAAGRNREH